jgi:hypothetical protein
MNYFKVLVALLASSTFISAASFCISELSPAEIATIQEIINQGDDLNQIQVHEGCYLKSTPESGRLLRRMVELDRPNSFALLYGCIEFRPIDTPWSNFWRLSDSNKSDLLLLAFRHHSIGICDFMLGQDFQCYYQLDYWPLDYPWTTRELRDLIFRHPHKAHIFATSLYTPWGTAMNVEETMDKIEINLHCTDDERYHPTAMLRDLIYSAFWGKDKDFATLFDRLIYAGAVVSEQMHADFAGKYRRHELAKNVLFTASLDGLSNGIQNLDV